MNLVNMPKWHHNLAIAFIAYVAVGIFNALFGLGQSWVLVLFSLAFIPMMFQLAKAMGETKPVLWAVLGIPMVCFFAVPVLLMRSMKMAKSHGMSANLFSIKLA